jgi:hypothetical protein
MCGRWRKAETAAGPRCEHPFLRILARDTHDSSAHGSSVDIDFILPRPPSGPYLLRPAVLWLHLRCCAGLRHGTRKHNRRPQHTHAPASSCTHRVRVGRGSFSTLERSRDSFLSSMERSILPYICGDARLTIACDSPTFSHALAYIRRPLRAVRPSDLHGPEVLLGT